jgi:putative ABC transport system permease protein
MLFWFILATKNIFRQKRRGLLIGLAMFVSSLFIILCFSWGAGMTAQMQENMVLGSFAHLQIFSGKYVQEERGELDSMLERPELTRDLLVRLPRKVESLLTDFGYVEAFHRRLVTKGFIVSPDNRNTAVFFGIEPQNEKALLKILRCQVREIGNREVVIGVDVAKKLKLDVGDRLHAVFAGTSGKLIRLELRVSAVFGNTAPWFSSTCYMDLGFMQKLLNLAPDELSEMAVTLHNPETAFAFQSILRDEFQNRDIRNIIFNWRESGQALLDVVEGVDAMLMGTYFILFLTTALGIMSVMLITVNERMKEIGTLNAIGMSFGQLLRLFIMETTILSTVCAITGGIVAAVLVDYLAAVGIYAGSNKTLSLIFGGDRLYMVWSNRTLVVSLMWVVLVSIVGTVYPVYKIGRKNPADTLRGNR